MRKELHLKKDGAFYEISPWALTWDDENYYLVAYDDKAGIIKHYRVHVLVSVSQQFFGWVTGVGCKMQIEGPENVRLEYKAYL
jgi:hypothetical protein